MHPRHVVPLVTALLLALVAVVVAGCGDTKTVTKTVTTEHTTTVTTTTSSADTTATDPSDEPNAAVDDCSGAEVHDGLASQGEVPGAVDATRADIFNAAKACSYTDLAQVAKQRGNQLKFTYGTESDPAAFWTAAEAKGDRPLGVLALVLNTPYAKDHAGNYVWPAIAAKDSPTDADWRQLDGIYPADKIAGFRKDGTYYGWRVGITPKGDWSFFVQGD